jgi:hypothetical protein
MIYEAVYGNQAELAPQSIAVTQHVFNLEGVRFIDVSFQGPSSQLIAETIIYPAVDTKGKEYGKDWVHIGYLAGGETAMATLAADLHYTGKDAYGTSLTSLPLMNEIKSMEDIDLVIMFAGAEFSWNLRQFAIPFNIPAVVGLLSLSYPDAVPFRASGHIVGTLNGMPGAAQYEFLVGKPGDAIASNDAISLTHYFLLVLVILGNIAYIAQRMTGEEK